MQSSLLSGRTGLAAPACSQSARPARCDVTACHSSSLHDVHGSPWLPCSACARRAAVVIAAGLLESFCMCYRICRQPVSCSANPIKSAVQRVSSAIQDAGKIASVLGASALVAGVSCRPAKTHWRHTDVLKGFSSADSAVAMPKEIADPSQPCCSAVCHRRH